MFVALVLEVTVTVVKQTIFTGVPVIEKRLLALLEFVVLVKKAAVPEPSSLTAEIVIVTPCGGMVEVIATVRGKSTWGAAACTELTGGVSVTTRFASGVGVGIGGVVGFFLQLPVITNKSINPAKTLTNDFLISNYLIEK